VKLVSIWCIIVSNIVCLYVYIHVTYVGWQGKIGDLELYKELRAKGEPSPLLRIAEHWLRKELEEKDAAGLKEEVYLYIYISIYLHTYISMYLCTHADR
jgi:hypothetical protein